MFRSLMAIAFTALLVPVLPGKAHASSLALQRILTSNGAETDIDTPIQVTFAPGDTRNLYILNRVQGTVQLYDRASGTLKSDPYLQLPSDLFQPDANAFSSFQTYSIAFDPHFDQTHKLYVSFIDPREHLRVVEFTADPNNPAKIDTGTRRNIISVPYGPDSGHAGGDLDFGPDGNLYLTTGDNRSPGAANSEINSQDPKSLEGKILQINPNSPDAFPDDDRNNFTPASGNAVVTDAIWASGLRNPYQATFDPKTGMYLIADVGEDRYEEINLGIAGANYGWPLREGTIEHPLGTINVGGLIFQDPLFEYPHVSIEAGASITGGLFYYGELQDLYGKYIFGDFVSNQIWSINPDAAANSASNLIEYVLESTDPLPIGLLSFGTGPDGEMYVVALNGIYRVVDGKVSPVPLPASGLLLLSAIGAVGFARRRKG